PASRWLGVDLSPAMLAEAAARGRTGPRFQPLCADAERLPLADAGQALVFSSFALQWCVPERVGAELGRVLMPSGSLLLAVPLAGSLHEMTDSWAAADRRPHVNRLPAEPDWRRALAGAGLSLQHAENLTFTEHYPDVKSLVRAFKATGVDHVQGGATGLTGKRAWRAMCDAYEARRQPAGLPLTWRVLFVHALR
ncbi:methyltransferase domain-containing protein, partial [Alloalcanivorax marinus]